MLYLTNDKSQIIDLFTMKSTLHHIYGEFVLTLSMKEVFEKYPILERNALKSAEERRLNLDSLKQE